MNWNAPARAGRLLARLGALAAEALCPPLCAACLTELERPGLLCAACRASLSPDGRSFCCRCGGDAEGPARHLLQRGCARAAHAGFRARCLYWMHGPVPLAIHGFKYRGVTRLASLWGREMGAWLRPGASALGADWVTEVPLHRARRAERGYNQSELLARAAASEAGLPHVPGVLSRVRRTPTQTRLGPAERRRNLEGAFRVEQAALVRGARIVLVDDVITTGATVSAAAAELQRAGASRVSVVAVARA